MELGTLAIGAIIGGGIGQTIGSVQSARANARAATAQAKQAEVEAQAVRETAAFEETQARRRAALSMGAREASTAAAGLDLSSGTPLFQALDDAKQAELEAMSIRRAGALSASGREFQGRLFSFEARQQRRSIPFKVAGGLTQTASNTILSSMLMTPSSAGNFTPGSFFGGASGT